MLDNIKLLKENVDRRILFDLDQSKIFFNPLPRVIKIKIKTNGAY